MCMPTTNPICRGPSGSEAGASEGGTPESFWQESNPVILSSLDLQLTLVYAPLENVYISAAQGELSSFLLAQPKPTS